MKVCSLILAMTLGTLAACQQTTRPTASTGERAIDPLSRNITQTQGGSLRDPLTPPPIRAPEMAIEGR